MVGWPVVGVVEKVVVVRVVVVVRCVVVVVVVGQLVVVVCLSVFDCCVLSDVVGVDCVFGCCSGLSDEEDPGELLGDFVRHRSPSSCCCGSVCWHRGRHCCR